MALVQLPCEVLLLIFHHLPTAKDALALAGTSVFMRRLFRQGNKLRILLPILGIPRGIPFDVDATQSGKISFYYYPARESSESSEYSEY